MEQSSDERTMSRRGVLVALTAGVGAVGVSDALDSDGPASVGGADLALGDDAATRTREAWRYGGMYFGPSTAPPTEAPA